MPQDDDKEPVRTRTPSQSSSRLQAVGLTAFEIQTLVNIRDLNKYLEPIISKVGDPLGPVMDRDISGHVHTTG